MPFDLEEITFDSNHELTVTVGYAGQSFAGHLSISKSQIILEVHADISEGRRLSLPMDNIDKLACTDLNTTILLHDLILLKGMSRTLDSGVSQREYKYEVGYLVFSKSPININQPFFGMQFHSDSIAKWIGNTNKQEAILGLYYTSDLFKQPPDVFNEFSCAVIDGVVGVEYKASVYHMSTEFRAGITFPPVFYFLFSTENGSEACMKKAKDVIAFFSFLTYGDINISKIDLLHAGFGVQKATLFFPIRDPLKNKSSCILYPLGRNLRHDTIGLPELQNSTFKNFFSHDERVRRFTYRYLKYKKFENHEERFLGFFRILEAITHKKASYLDGETLSRICKKYKPELMKEFNDKKSVNGFLKRIPKWNSMKYNTEKCISDLLISIPIPDDEKWIYDRTEIVKICQFRNDITHANEYEVDSETIYRYESFIEILLVYSLLDLLGVSPESAMAICSRLPCYDWILKRDY